MDMDGTTSQDAPPPRRQGRVAVDFPVSPRRQGAQRFSVRLIDLSVHAFCTEVDNPVPLHPSVLQAVVARAG